MHFYEVVPVDHLLERLALDRACPAVCTAMTELLLNSFYPQQQQQQQIGGSGELTADGGASAVAAAAVAAAKSRQQETELLRRCVQFVEQHAPAAEVFYAHLSSFVPIGYCSKLATLLFTYLVTAEARAAAADTASAQQGEEEEDEGEQKGAAGGKRRRAQKVSMLFVSVLWTEPSLSSLLLLLVDDRDRCPFPCEAGSDAGAAAAAGEPAGAAGGAAPCARADRQVPHGRAHAKPRALLQPLRRFQPYPADAARRTKAGSDGGQHPQDGPSCCWLAHH